MLYLVYTNPTRTYMCIPCVYTLRSWGHARLRMTQLRRAWYKRVTLSRYIVVYLLRCVQFHTEHGNVC